MSAAAHAPVAGPAGEARLRGLERVDWERVMAELDERGSAVIGKLLTAAECASLTASWQREDAFRSRIGMARHTRSTSAPCAVCAAITELPCGTG